MADIVTWPLRHPLPSVGVFQAITTAITIAAVTITGPFPAFLEVGDPSSTLQVAWQVQAAFASIAFAGLAILLQVASEPAVTSKSARQVLFEHTGFVPALGMSLIGTLQLGVISTWFATSPAVIFQFMFVVVTTVGSVAFAYWRAAEVFAQPGLADELGTQALLADARRSIEDSWVRQRAEQCLETVVPRTWSVSGEVVAISLADGVLSDVNEEALRDVVKSVAVMSSPIPTGAAAGGPLPNVSNPKQTLEVRIAVGLGSQVTAGQPLFVLEGGGSYGGDLQRLRDQLLATLRWTR